MKLLAQVVQGIWDEVGSSELGKIVALLTIGSSPQYNGNEELLYLIHQRSQWQMPLPLPLPRFVDGKREKSPFWSLEEEYATKVVVWLVG